MSEVLTAIRNEILFTFVNNTTGGKFAEVRKSGIIVAGPTSNTMDLSSQHVPQWGHVLAVGPEVLASDVVVGNYILIESLKWTTGMQITIDDVDVVWKTDVKSVLCVSETHPLE